MNEQHGPRPEPGPDDALREILAAPEQDEHASAEAYTECRLRGLQTLREHALQRRANRNRHSEVEAALTVLAELGPREHRVKTTPCERKDLWVARTVLAGNRPDHAEDHWNTHKVELLDFFSDVPFTAKAGGRGGYDLDFTTMLEQRPDRIAQVRSAFNLLSALTAPELGDTERDALLDDITGPAKLGDADTTTLTQLRRLHSALAQARLSGVPQVITDAHLGHFNFQDPDVDHRYHQQKGLLNRAARGRLAAEPAVHSSTFIYADKYIDSDGGMMHHALRAAMRDARAGAWPRQDPWKAASLSCCETFTKGLPTAIEEHKATHGRLPVSQSDDDGAMGDIADTRACAEETALRLLTSDADFLSQVDEAVRDTVQALLTGPSALRGYYSLKTHGVDKCIAAAEAARFWLLAAPPGPTVANGMRAAARVIVSTWTGAQLMRDLPFVIWTAKELLDDFSINLDNPATPDLLVARIKLRVAVLATLPASVRSRTDQRPQARLAAVVGDTAMAVLDELAALLAVPFPSTGAWLNNDPDLGSAALMKVEQDLLNTAYGTLPEAAQRLREVVVASRLHPVAFRSQTPLYFYERPRVIAAPEEQDS